MKLIVFLWAVGMAVAQPWSGIIAPSRATDWTKSGLPSSITYGSGGGACNGTSANCVETITNRWTPPTRVQAGSTITCTNTSSDLTTINNAIAAALPGSYVLVTGTCNLNGGTLNLNSRGVTLRGTSPQTASLVSSTAFTIRFGNPTLNGSGALSAASYSAGATSVVLTNASGNPPTNAPARLSQCDTGFSGASCGTGSVSDPVGVWVCGGTAGECSQSGDGGSHGGTLTSGSAHQQQFVLVTGVSGDCTQASPGCTVTFAPGLYMPNWSSANSAIMQWATVTSGWGIGNAMENLTVTFPTPASDIASVGSIDTGYAYGWWMTGNRLIGTSAGNIMNLSGLSGLWMSNYVPGINPTYFRNGQNEPTLRIWASSVLILNNIITGGNGFWGNGAVFGEVLAYNYSRDSTAAYYQNKRITHLPTSGFNLAEGNQIPQDQADNTHGTQNFESMFRSHLFGWDPPYYTMNPVAVIFQKNNRFYNYIGNVIGDVRTSGYQGASAGAGYEWDIENSSTFDLATLMRWGNVGYNSGVRWQASEVPTSTVMPGATYPNAAAYQNFLPADHNLPCSLFLSSSSAACSVKYSGGTGLSWWKVCKTWTTFPTACADTQTQPFPPIGPEVSGGSYVSGYAYDIPAAVAYKYLPIDTSLQQSYTITSSTWSNDAATCGSHTVNGITPCEILTVTKPGGVYLGNGEHLMGGFSLSGVNSACLPASLPLNGEILMTGSAYTTGAGTATVTYALASNPGLQCTGTMLFPNVRQFDARVYQADSGSIAAATVVTITPPSSIGSTTASVSGNVTSDGGATVTARGTCYATSANPTSPCTSDGTGTGSFTSSLAGLNPATLYHYRAFATNSAGTSYGLDQSFTTSGLASGASVSGSILYSGTTGKE